MCARSVRRSILGCYRLERSYKSGRVVVVPPNFASNGSLFHAHFEESLSHSLSSRERETFEGLSNARKGAFKLTVKGQLKEAKEQFEICSSRRQKLPKSSILRLLCSSFEMPSVAYLNYRLGRFDLAKANLVSAIASDFELERYEQFSILAAHRVQLLINFAKVIYQEGLIEKAICFCLDLLRFLSGHADAGTSFPLSAEWDVCSFARLHESFEPALMADCFFEMTRMMIANPRLASAALDMRYDLLTEDEGRLASHILGHWARTKRAYFNGNISSFAKNAEALLEAGPVPISAIWYSVVHDSVVLCLTEPHDRAAQFVEMVRQDWPDYPAPIQDNFIFPTLKFY